VTLERFGQTPPGDMRYWQAAQSTQANRDRLSHVIKRPRNQFVTVNIGRNVRMGTQVIAQGWRFGNAGNPLAIYDTGSAQVSPRAQSLGR